MECLIANEEREEIGYFDEENTIDVDIGSTNDFEIVTNKKRAKTIGLKVGCNFFIAETEYGGILEETESDTNNEMLVLRGDTWRGLLDKIIIEPPKNASHLVVSGDANRIIEEILKSGTGEIFKIPKEDAGIKITKHSFRYISALEGLTKMLLEVGAKLEITTKKGNSGNPFEVIVQAVPIKNQSEEIEYNGDDNVNVTTRISKRGINHLICLGKGELQERTVIHLYAQLDGSVATKQYFTGKNERTAVYDYSSAEDDNLHAEGEKKLKELMDFATAEMKVENVDLGIGDIISARDRESGMVISKPVIGKILKSENGKTVIEYKVEGEN